MTHAQLAAAAACAVASVLVFSAPARSQTFQDVTAGSGLGVVQPATAEFGKGQCCADFDGDGDLDLLVAGNDRQDLHFFRNDGGMTFTDRTVAAGFQSATPSGVVRGIVAADIDNDGDQDAYVCGWYAPPQLWINDGAAHFTEQAAARGLTHVEPNFSASFGDYDRDGWLDLYVGNRYYPGEQPGTSGPANNILYRNTGNGYFQDVTASAGVGSPGLTFVGTFIDYNEDGWPDIVCVNDRGASQVPNQLFRNNGDGTFTAVGQQMHCDEGVDGMGVDYVDVFNDGGVDFFCTDTPPDHLFELWDPALGHYVNATARFGLTGGEIGWAAHWFDYDNDGWQDLHICHLGTGNNVYHNPGMPESASVVWPEVSAQLQLDADLFQTTALVADFDGDGGLDVLEHYWSSASQPTNIGMSMRRNGVVRGHWVEFTTRGTVSNRDGLGARVEVFANGLHQRQWVRSGIGFMGGNPHRVHFGLGSATQVDAVRVTWPSGQQSFRFDVPADGVVSLVEPRMRLAAVPHVGGSSSIDLSIPSDAGLVYAMFLSATDSPTTPLADGRSLPLPIDGLALATSVPGNSVLPGSVGVLGPAGDATSALRLPAIPQLAGLTVFSTALTLDVVHFAPFRTLFPKAVEIPILP